MTNGKVLLVIAHKGFQHVEYGEPKKVLEDAGYTVVTASDKESPATGKDDSQVGVDIVLKDVKANDYHGVFFIGGPGTLEHLDNQESYRILREANEANLPFGAICIATRILAKANVLKDRHATGWNDDNQLEQLYQKHGTIYTRDHVVVDSNIVTASGPHVATEFAQKIIQVIQDHKGWG